MKIIVDKMPDSVEQCPYSHDVDGYKEYRCTWNQCGKRCYCTEDCPFFADDSEKRRYLGEILKYNLKSGKKLGDLTVMELRGILMEMR